MATSRIFQEGLGRYFTQGQIETLGRARVGIAGAGGLGSNAALMLARCGVGNFLLADYDRVEPSNLNRQQFWPRHVGMLKTEALASQLTELNPQVNIKFYSMRLTCENIPEILPFSELWLEALDYPETKAMFVNLALAAGKRVIAGSGLCGTGGEPMRKRSLGKLTVAGDFTTSLECAPPLAPRVTQAAALMADCALEFLLAKSGNASKQAAS